MKLFDLYCTYALLDFFQTNIYTPNNIQIFFIKENYELNLSLNSYNYCPLNIYIYIYITVELKKKKIKTLKLLLFFPLFPTSKSHCQ